MHKWLATSAKSANLMPKGAIFKKECNKVLFNSFVMMQLA